MKSRALRGVSLIESGASIFGFAIIADRSLSQGQPLDTLKGESRVRQDFFAR